VVKHAIRTLNDLHFGRSPPLSIDLLFGRSMDVIGNKYHKKDATIRRIVYVALFCCFLNGRVRIARFRIMLMDSLTLFLYVGGQALNYIYLYLFFKPTVGRRTQ
jgi:hypothetical protein